MKKLISWLFSLSIILSLLCPFGYAYGSVQPNGLPDVFPRTASIDDVKAPPTACFTSYGSENGLEGLTCYLVGKVIRYEDMETNANGIYHCFILQTEYGYVFVMDIYTNMIEYGATTPEVRAEIEESESDYSFPVIGEFVKVLCIYVGYSEVYKMPMFYYGTPKSILIKYSKEVSSNQPQQTYIPTAGESNALKKAYQYLNVMPFSRSGLVSQLEYDGFSTAEATYAVDNCNEDWNEQAVSKAAQYLSLMGFSKDRLIQQLEHDGFTHDQAVYGVEHNGY